MGPQCRTQLSQPETTLPDPHPLAVCVFCTPLGAFSLQLIPRALRPVSAVVGCTEQKHLHPPGQSLVLSLQNVCLGVEEACSEVELRSFCSNDMNTILYLPLLFNRVLTRLRGFSEKPGSSAFSYHSHINLGNSKSWSTFCSLGC